MGMFVSTHSFSQVNFFQDFGISIKTLPSDEHSQGPLNKKDLTKCIQSSFSVESKWDPFPPENTFNLINGDEFFLASLILLNSPSNQSEIVKTYFNGECQLAFPEIKVFQVYNNAKKSESYFNYMKIREKEDIKLEYSSKEYG